MCWALNQADPEGWLKMPNEGYDWVFRNDGQFKAALDHSKYPVRYPNIDTLLERDKAAKFLYDLDTQIANGPWMFGENCSLADVAILPFVRQFANIDNDWFNTQCWQNLRHWLTSFLNSNKFNSIMTKYDKWVAGTEIVSFPYKPKLFPAQSFTVRNLR